MSARQDGQPKSWRYSSGSGRSSSGGSAGRSTVRGRRVIWTGLLVLAMAAGATFVYWLLTRRFQHTLVAYMATTSKTYTSEPEHPYTLPPLRFTSETIAPLSQYQSDEFRVEALPDAFNSADNLTAAVSSAISSLERDDALIVWIRAKGVSLAGKPYLLSGNYDLPQRPDDLDHPQGAVAWEVLVQAVQQWAGTSLILLDWGNQPADARAGQWENDFVALAVQEITQAPERVHCLVSHLPGQISQDAFAERQTLFGRSCAEALIGPRRLPGNYQAVVSSKDSLLLGDLAEYVIRRVMADSGLRQTPWLVQGRTGWANGDPLAWAQQTNLPLVKLGRDLRPLRWPPLETAAGSESEAADDAEKTRATPNAEQVELNESQWPTSPLWQALDKWTTASADLGDWSLETIAPLNRRRFATLTADLEARWFAGEDFRGGTSRARMQVETDELLREIQSGAEEVRRSIAGSPLAAIEAKKPAGVSDFQFAAWQKHIGAIGAARRLALRLSDCVHLADGLSNLEGTSADFRETVRGAISVQRRFNVSTSNAFGPEASKNASTSLNWTGLTDDLNAAHDQINQQLDALLQQVVAEPLGNQAKGELLVRFCWLSQPQRESLLRSAFVNMRPVETEIFWPEKQLSQLAPPEPQSQGFPSRAETLWPELLASTNSGLTQRTERAVLASMTSSAAKLLNQTEFTESDWYIVDGRDLCQKQNGWPVAWQMPNLLPLPQPAPQWQLSWHLPKPAGIRRSDNEFVLASGTEPAELDFRLTRRGDADSIGTIRALASGVLIRLRLTDRGVAGDWQSELQLTASDLLKAADLSDETWYLPLELKGLGDSLRTSDPFVRITVEAGKHTPAPESIVCRLPIPTPVACDVQQLVRRNARDVWESCDQNAGSFTVRPIAGRLSQLRLVVSNLDNEPREATIQLYAVPPLGNQTPKGRLNLLPGAVPPLLQDQSLARFKRLVVSNPILLAPRQREVIVDLTPGDQGERQIGTDLAAKSTSTEAGTSELDVSWGLLAVVRLASEKTREWRSWIEFVPRDASEYLQVESNAGPDGKTIRFELALRDDDRDGQPDLAPIDFNAENPLRILADIGGGIELRRAMLPPMNRILAPDKLQDSFAVVSQDRINDEVELRLDVDGSPRAICHYVGLGGRAGRREPPDRMWIESIAMAAKDGLRYTRGFKLNRGEKERELGPLGAVFKRPVTGPIDIVLAADVRSSRDQSTPENALQLRLARPGWEIKFGPRTGDRDLMVKIPHQPTTSIPIYATLSDWTFSLDASTLGDMEAYFQGSVAGSGERRLTGGRFVLDGEPPRQFGRESVQEIYQGQNSRLVFAVREMSGIARATIMLGLAGQPASAQPIVEALPADQFIPISGGWQANPVILPLKQRPAGEYEITVQIEDLVGNAGKLGPWKLIIKPPNVSASGPGGQFKAPIGGKLYFGTTTSKPPNPVTVTIKDVPGKSATSQDGTFSIPDVEAGSYEIQAASEHRGFKYEGSAKIVLKNPDDWKRAIEISLKRK